MTPERLPLLTIPDRILTVSRKERLMKRLGYACLLLVLVPLAATATGTRINLQDYRALIRITSPQFSPDGKELAFLTVRSDFVHDRYDATLRVLDIASGKSLILVQGMRDLEMPRWSPDGKTIAYVTPDESPISKKDRRTHHDLFTIHDDDYLINKPPVPSHIWLLSVKDGKAHQLTFGPTSVLETAPPIGGGVSAPVWSADGKWIVYAQQANADDSDSDRTRIVAVNVATGDEHPIT